MKILVINGPNLNLLGTREPEIYGELSLNDIEKKIFQYGKELNVSVEFYQSNIEGEIIDKLQSTNAQGIIINPAGYTHTSVAIRDAISAIKIPTVEVHMSNIYSREDFRKESLTAPVCVGQISGFKENAYILGLKAIVDYLNNPTENYS